jgi:hypothetical protein
LQRCHSPWQHPSVATRLAPLVNPLTWQAVQWLVLRGYRPVAGDIPVGCISWGYATAVDALWWHPTKRFFLLVELKKYETSTYTLPVVAAHLVQLACTTVLFSHTLYFGTLSQRLLNMLESATSTGSSPKPLVVDRCQSATRARVINVHHIRPIILRVHQGGPTVYDVPSCILHWAHQRLKGSSNIPLSADIYR